MKCFAVVAATLAIVCSVQANDAAPDGGKPWSYKTNDKNAYGPADWKLKFPACGGQRQSPIDIVPKDNCDESQTRQKSPLVLSGECSKYSLHEYEDTYKLEAVDSTCQVSANGKPATFLQAHFHSPSEHTFRGKAHDGEMHFVHKSNDGLLVIGLFMEKKADATTDPFLQKFWQQVKGVTATAPANTTLASYFPALESSMKKGRMFNYPGSLTTPGCNETVDWWVLEKPLPVSSADFKAMQGEMKRLEAVDNGKNARPTQPLNGRIISAY